MRSRRSRRRLPSSSSRSRSGRQLTFQSPGPGRSNPPFVAITNPEGYGCSASAIRSSETCGPYDSAVSMRSTPSSIARRSTRRHSSRSFGGPQTPFPVTRIAPNPSRCTRSSPREKTLSSAPLIMSTYDSSAIEVLTGLEPVRKRPGMYTTTERPNHLAQEVIDNAADEAIAGYCDEIVVTLHEDGSLSVADNGRGMPVDKHAKEGVSGVEVILTRLHAGAKFSEKNYRYSGGLHGVGVSVVNALSKKLQVWVRRDGNEYSMTFADGKKKSELKVVGQVGKRNTGTTVRFWADEKFFDSSKFSVPRLKHVMRAKAVLSPGLRMRFISEVDQAESEEWYFEDGLKAYLISELAGLPMIPEEPFVGHVKGTDHEVDWAVVWLPEDSDVVGESYVNLIPTAQGGTHVNGFRTGLTEAIREFWQFRNLLPRGVKPWPEDVWARCSYILSVRMTNPHFTGQTKD